jgi:nicotinamide mononucleotide (NMN) deamidase PncC
MSRTAAKVTQADVARAIRAAKQAGAKGVEIRPDGTIYISLTNGSEFGKPPAEEDAVF